MCSCLYTVESDTEEDASKWHHRNIRERDSKMIWPQTASDRPQGVAAQLFSSFLKTVNDKFSM